MKTCSHENKNNKTKSVLLKERNSIGEKEGDTGKKGESGRETKEKIERRRGEREKERKGGREVGRDRKS